MTNYEFKRGWKAHASHTLRTGNPHIQPALDWDAGWRSRQIEQLHAGGCGRVRVSRFKEWIWGHLR